MATLFSEDHIQLKNDAELDKAIEFLQCSIGDVSIMKNEDDLQRTARLLGISPDQSEDALVKEVVKRLYPLLRELERENHSDNDGDGLTRLDNLIASTESSIEKTKRETEKYRVHLERSKQLVAQAGIKPKL